MERLSKECLPVWKRDGVRIEMSREDTERQVTVQRVKLYCKSITKCHMLSLTEKNTEIDYIKTVAML